MRHKDRKAPSELYLEILASDPDPAVRRDVADRLLDMHEEAPLAPETLEQLVNVASEEGDLAICHRALEVLAQTNDPLVRARALERRGYLFAQIGNRQAAIDSWKPAATLCEEREHAQRLYERVLETMPDDRESAEQLADLYAKADDWTRLPEVVGVVIRADEEQGAELVLRLEGSACMAGALEKFVSLVDEAAALRPLSSSLTSRLYRAKARALSSDPTRLADASATYRTLLETYGCDEDRCAYESFIGSIRDRSQQREERQWLLEWELESEQRAFDNASDEERPPIVVRIAWLLEELGHAEDAGFLLERHGDYERAAAVWERSRDWLRAMNAHERAAAAGSVVSTDALALTHAMAARWSEAAQALGWLVKNAKVEARTAYALRLSDALLALNDQEGARSCLEEALGEAAAPRTASRVRRRLIELYRQASVHRSLVDALSIEASVSQIPEEAAALYHEAAGILDNELGEPVQAVWLLERAVAASSADAGLRLVLADSLEALGQWSRVADVLAEQAALYGGRCSKERALVHHRRWRALSELSRREEARAELELAAKMDPTHPAILHDLARAAIEDGDHDLAERSYRSLLMVSPEPMVFLQLGRVLAEKGDAVHAANLVEAGLDQILCRSRLQEDGCMQYAYDAVSALARVHKHRPVAKRSVRLAQVCFEVGKVHLARYELTAAFDVLQLGFGLDREHREMAILLGAVALDLRETGTAQRVLRSGIRRAILSEEAA